MIEKKKGEEEFIVERKTTTVSSQMDLVEELALTKVAARLQTMRVASQAIDNFVENGQQIQRFFRGKIEVEKGVTLNRERIEKNMALYKIYCNFFSAYPDLFIDLITPVDSKFKLFFYQRIFIRACLRYRYHYCTAPRAFSKTFVSLLALYLKCMFQPGSKIFICAPGKEQSAKIATEKIREIWSIFPLLKKEIIGEGNFGHDYIKLPFRNGSLFDVVGALDTTRGGRRHGKRKKIVFHLP